MLYIILAPITVTDSVQNRARVINKLISIMGVTETWSRQTGAQEGD